MKKTRLWLFIIIVSFPLHNLYSQGDYILTDSTLSTGVKLIRGNSRDNAQYIRLKRKNQEMEYTPEQLTEYGFKNGTVYVSKDIPVSGQTKKVFLERLEYGKITLYYYKERGINTYFLEKDSTVFVELPKNEDEFKKRISENTNDFNWKAAQVQLVNYNRKSLSKLIAKYNHSDNRPLPYPRFGIIAGYSRTSLTVPSGVSNKFLADISFKPGSSILLGVFADLPIEMSYFSLNTGVNVTKSGFSVNSVTPESDIDVVVNITSVNVPVLLRYTLPTLVWRPFINAGGVYSYHLTNQGKIYESSIDQNVITINEATARPFIADNLLGYSFGIGLQHNLNYKKIVSAELRYNQLLGSENTLDKGLLDILFSFSF